MHGSHIPPHKWIQAYLTVIDDPKITSKKLAGLVGISYVGAWKIRRIVREEIREDKKLETEIQQALDELVKEGKVIIIKEHEDPAERVYQNVRTP